METFGDCASEPASLTHGCDQTSGGTHAELEKFRDRENGGGNCPCLEGSHCRALTAVWASLRGSSFRQLALVACESFHGRVEMMYEYVGKRPAVSAKETAAECDIRVHESMAFSTVQKTAISSKAILKINIRGTRTFSLSNDYAASIMSCGATAKHKTPLPFDID